MINTHRNSSTVWILRDDLIEWEHEIMSPVRYNDLPFAGKVLHSPCHGVPLTANRQQASQSKT